MSHRLVVPLSHLSHLSLSPLSRLSLSPLSRLSLTSLSPLSHLSLSPLSYPSLSDMQALAGIHVKKYLIYDVIFIDCKDVYVYCASDHVIGVIKEHQAVGGGPSSYSIYNKIYHNQLHIKLCYNEKNDILCSISSNRVIYGWTLGINYNNL
jgi:hypothetical protein